MLFFVKKGYGKEYITGLAKGFALCRRDKKVQFCWKHLGSYLKIQWELWVNVDPACCGLLTEVNGFD